MSDNKVDFLADWTVTYLKNRDIIAKKIVNIAKNDNIIDVTFKDKKGYYIIQPITNDNGILLTYLEKEGAYVTLVCFNRKENLTFLIKSWGQLSQSPRFNIIFVNPFSNMDKRWIICPHTHNRIADESSFNEGLNSLFETVDEITDEQMNNVSS